MNYDKPEKSNSPITLCRVIVLVVILAGIVTTIFVLRSFFFKQSTVFEQNDVISFHNETRLNNIETQPSILTSTSDLLQKTFNKADLNRILPIDSIQFPHSINSSSKQIAKFNALPIAFGDLNSDGLTDIFMLSNQGLQLEMMKGETCVDGKTILSYFGSRQCLSHFKNFKCEFKNRIHNVAAFDFTGRFYQDLLITVESENSDKLYDIFLIYGNTLNEFNCSKQMRKIFSNAISQPFILDYDGDMISDFIVETNDCLLFLVSGIWIANLLKNDTSNFNTVSSNKHDCLAHLTTITKLSNPHSSGFLNLNSFTENMTPDIYVSGIDKFDYIFNEPKRGFVQSHKAKKYPQHKVLGQSAFFDIDYNGKLEHLIPLCKDSNNFKECETPVVMGYDENHKKWHNLLANNDSHFLGKYFNRSLTFTGRQIFDYINLPVTLQIADINYDGYPDFATVLYDKNKEKNVAAIFINKPDEKSSWKRAFYLDWVGDFEDDVVLVMFFNIFNNGRVNLLITTRSHETEELETKSFDYYVEKSLYYSFLEVNVITGLCSNKFETNSCPTHLAFGAIQPGASACFEGAYSNEHSCSVQLAQSAHFSMQLPFMIFGLGDTLNVVNDLLVSVANGKNPDRKREWDEVIPGSNLVVIPYKLDETSKWELRIFVFMSYYSMFILAALILLMGLLVLIILGLHWREKFEDRSEKIQYRKTWLT